MSDISIGLIQAALLLGIGHFSGSRPLLTVAAFAVAGATLAVGYPESLSRPWPELAASLVGIVAGAALGWAAIRAREKRLGTSVRQRALLAASRERAGGTRKGFVAGLAAVLLLAAGGALYVEDDTLRALRATAQGWLASPAPQAPAARSAAGVAPAGRAPSTVRAGDAGKAMTAGHPAGPTGADAAGAARRPAPEDPTHHRAAAERPRGDLRHCLELPSASDVLRCAER
jgi:hypothetical protein